jgi:predicted nucleic acid-binding protein
MSGEALVLDTNAVIMLLEDESKSIFLDELFPDNARAISVITQIELLGYPDITEATVELILSFLDGTTIISIDSLIVEIAVQIRREKPSVKLPDAVIAATAAAIKAPLVTNDTGLHKLDWPGLQTVTIE